MKKARQSIVPAAMILCASAVPGTAASIMVANFSFESPDITNAVTTGVPDNWTTPNGATGVKYRDNYAPLATVGIPDGNQWALITFSTVGTSNTAVTLAQDTGETIIEGMTYKLTVAIGEQDNQAGVDNIARILLYGSTAGDVLPFAILDDIDPIPDANITGGDDSIWIDYQISFTATAAQAGQSLVIGLGAGTNISNNSGGSINANVNYDNVRLEAVPEPGVLALVSICGIGLLLRKRSR